MMPTVIDSNRVLRDARTPNNPQPRCCAWGSYSVTTVTAFRSEGGLLRAREGATMYETRACVFHVDSLVRSLRAHSAGRYLVTATFHESPVTY